MLYFVHAIDKPGGQEIRDANRKKHRNHLALFRDNVLCAGPTLAEDMQTRTGTVMMIEAEDRDAVDGFLNKDPYVKAGLYESISVAPWKKVDHGDVG